MVRRRLPPELRRRNWTEGSVWELLVAGELLPYRFVSPFADLGLSRRERRQLHCEAELLKATSIAYILPHPGTARRPAQPWLYVRTRRGGHYRVGEGGEINRYSRRTQSFGSGSITEHGWYHCSLRGVRLLQVVANSRLVRKVGSEEHHTFPLSVECLPLTISKPPQPASPDAVQLALFVGSESELNGLL